MFTRIMCLSAVAAALLAIAPATSEAQVRVGIGRGYGGGVYGGGYGGGRYYGGGYGGYGNRYYGGYGQPGISIGIGSGYYGGGYRSGYYSNGYYPSYGSTIIAAPVTPSYQSYYPSMTNDSFASSSADGTASIAVRVPANAQVWWNGSPSTVGGEMRLFRTAPLSSEGSTQTFQARWTGADGQQVSQTREVRVTPNGNFNVDFNQPDSNRVPTGK